MHDWIELTDIRLDCIIGLLDREQRAPQQVVLDVRMALPLEETATTGYLSRSLDYAVVLDQVRTLAEHGRWRLVESLALAVARLLLAPPAPQEARGQVERVEIAVRKPEVLGGVAVPGVRVVRDASWCDLATALVAPKVWLDVLQETPMTGAYRAHVDPGGSWKPPAGAALQVIAGAPFHGPDPLRPGDRIARGTGRPIENPQAAPVSLLVVSQPPIRT